MALFSPVRMHCMWQVVWPVFARLAQKELPLSLEVFVVLLCQSFAFLRSRVVVFYPFNDFAAALELFQWSWRNTQTMLESTLHLFIFGLTCIGKQVLTVGKFLFLPSLVKKQLEVTLITWVSLDVTFVCSILSTCIWGGGAWVGNPRGFFQINMGRIRLLRV